MEELKKKMSYSLTSIDLLKNINYKAHIYRYSDLTKFNTIKKAFYPHHIIFLLYETKKNYGHWCCLLDKKNSIEHFDSYGIFPDDELKQTPLSFRMENKMELPHLTALLYKSKRVIEYNNYKLQEYNKKIATCGRWCLIRAKYKDVDIDNFANIFLNRKFSPDEIITLLTYNI